MSRTRELLAQAVEAMLDLAEAVRPSVAPAERRFFTDAEARLRGILKVIDDGPDPAPRDGPASRLSSR